MCSSDSAGYVYTHVPSVSVNAVLGTHVLHLGGENPSPTNQCDSYSHLSLVRTGAFGSARKPNLAGIQRYGTNT